VVAVNNAAQANTEKPAIPTRRRDECICLDDDEWIENGQSETTPKFLQKGL
jgi:hypothetical protein